MKNFLKVFLWISSCLFLSLIGACFIQRSSDKVIRRWVQPKEIQYESFDPYSVFVIERGLNLWSIPWEPHHELRIGTQPDYGYMVAVSFDDDDIKKAKVDWAQDGLRFTRADGSRLYVPKTLFIGGR